MEISLAAPVSVTRGITSRTFLSDKVIGTSDCNDYIPFYAIFFHTFLSFEEKGVSVLEYGKATFEVVSNMPSYREYKDLLEQINSTDISAGVEFQFITAGVTHYVYIHRHYICSSNGEILLSLGVDSKYLIETPFTEVSTNPNKDKFKLFVSAKLDAPEYKNLRRKLDKDYIQPSVGDGIDVIYTKDIDNRFFRNNFKLPTVTRLSERRQYFEKTLQDFVETL